MNQKTLDQIMEHARIEAPRECCGLIVVRDGKERYVRCRNLADGVGQFILSADDYAEAEESGDILKVVHSHYGQNAQPSEADLVSCESSGLPWVIVSTLTGEVREFAPSGYKAPLYGRTWAHEVLDCYTLIRDWYREERGIELIDFERRPNWWKKGDNLYLENFERAGFREVQDGTLTQGDVILMNVLSDVVNHAAIYLGDDLMLHHLQNRLSGRQIYDGYWRKHTRKIVRYVGA